MKWFLVALLGLGIALPMLATESFAQYSGNQTGNGYQAGDSQSGQTGYTGNQGNNGKSVGNAGGTHK
jgi:hypothetical protein